MLELAAWRPRSTTCLPCRGRTSGCRPAPTHDRLTPLQRRAMVGAIVAAHVAAVWALLQVREVRDAVADVAPIFVSLVAPATPPKIAPPPPPPPDAARAPTDRARAAHDHRRAEPGAGTVRRAAAARARAARARAGRRRGAGRAGRTAAARARAAAQSLGLLGPVPGAAPGRIPAPLEATRRDRRGHAAHLHRRGGSRSRGPGQSHIGSPRLDDAAMAAVQKARFKPPSENGQAVSGYAQVPVDFQLER